VCELWVYCLCGVCVAFVCVFLCMCVCVCGCTFLCWSQPQTLFLAEIISSDRKTSSHLRVCGCVSAHLRVFFCACICVYG